MQLAIDNTLAPYLGSQFGFSTNKAANLASIFGMMNFWARPLGGFLSDIVGRRYETKSEACLLEPSLSPVLTLLLQMSIACCLGPGSLQLMHSVEQASALHAAVVSTLFVYQRDIAWCVHICLCMSLLSLLCLSMACLLAGLA